MNNLTVIQGSGGGGGGKGGGGSGRVAVEARDSLRSKQYAKVVDLLCEGPIEGFVRSDNFKGGSEDLDLSSVYFNDTPVLNLDATANFTDVTVEARVGTQSQTAIPGMGAVEAENSVGVRIRKDTPVTRTINSPNLTAIRVTVSIPQLSTQNATTGDINGTSVTIAIDVDTNGGGLVEKVVDTIEGKTMSRYQKAYRIALTGSGPWTVRLRRVTDDSTSAALVNQTFWDSYTEIVEAKLGYPNSALVAVAVDAAKFGSIPTRAYKVKGLLVKIPSNYNPITRAYTGAWNGSFTLAWTNNPAWCFYDLLTSKRYGLGNYLPEAKVDKWALYQIAQYCDVMVPTGIGNKEEPRFTCNLYLQTREEAYSVINNFAAIFCSMAYWSSGSVVTVQDAPSAPVALFTSANVIDGQFTYTGSSLKTRHTVALVSWNDPDDMYKSKIEYVEDAAGIEKYGVVQTEVVALGCTSRGQAHRYGRRILYTERMETETISFRTGLEGLSVAPGEIITTTDSVRAGVRLGGRLLDATLSTLTLDSPVTLAAKVVYTLWTIMPDGSTVSRVVSTLDSTTSILTVSPDLPDVPQAMAMWVLASTVLAPETWRVISISEVENTQAEISALKYSPSKYDEIEKNLILEPIPTSVLNARTQAGVTDVKVTESLFLVTRVVVGARITVSWSCEASYYEIEYRVTNGNWKKVSSAAPSVDIDQVSPGTYEFSIVAFNALGVQSSPRLATGVIFGLTSKPRDVLGYGLTVNGSLAQLTFNASEDLDVIVGGYLRVRHSKDMLTPSWSNSVDIGAQIPGTATAVSLPLMAGSYLAKWVDSSGNESPTPIYISTDAPRIMALNVVDTITESTTFTGARTLTYVVNNRLILDSQYKITEQSGLMSTWDKLSIQGGVASRGEYFFSRGLTLASVQVSRLTAAVSIVGIGAADTIRRRELVSTWLSVNGALITDVGCRIYVRTSLQDSAASPTWSAWAPFFMGDYTARSFQFKAVLTSESPTHNLEVSQLSVSIDMPDRTFIGNDLSSGTAVRSVAYNGSFIAMPAIGITAQNMVSGDYYSLSNKTLLGFDIVFRNSAGAAISRTFDYISRGY